MHAPIQEFPLRDGRILRLSWLGVRGLGLMRDGKTDKYRMKSGVITAINCVTHGWQETTEYYVMNTRGRVEVRCRECNLASKKIVPWKDSRHIPIECKTTTGPDGLDGRICNSCQTWKPLIDFGTRPGRKNKNGRGNRHLHYRCRECETEWFMRWKYLGRIGETFGEDSEEYGFAKNEKRGSRIKAMCWVFGILTRPSFLSAAQRKIRRVLRRMSDFTPEEFSRLVEAKVQEIEAKRKRHHSVEV